MELVEGYETLPNSWKERIIYNENGCWVWTGGKSGNGYASGNYNKKTVRVHRVIYSLLVKNPENGLELDHLCRNRNCVNPHHLEEVTHLENMRRGLPSIKTRCKRGHDLSGDNLLSSTPGRRSCRLCGRIRVFEWRSKHGRSVHG